MINYKAVLEDIVVIHTPCKKNIDGGMYYPR